MALTKQITSNHNQLAESSIDAEAMEALLNLRRRTTLEEVTDEA